MFVATGYPRPLLVLNPAGKVIEVVKVDCKTYRMTYCKASKVLYIAADDILLRYRWDGRHLEEMASSAHGVPGFLCCDICICRGGEVLATGLMNHDRVDIYLCSVFNTMACL
jgi:hypothetical protein